MSYEYSEDGLIEEATEEVLLDLRWKVKTAWRNETLSVLPDRTDGLLGRASKSEVILVRYLLNALKALNPNLPQSAYQQAIELITATTADNHLGAINQAKHKLLTKGVPVSFQNDKGELQKKRLKVFDFNNPTNNDYLAVRQLEICGRLYNRRPDIVGFVNGIPLVFFELKAHHTDLRNGYEDNLSDYKDTIPEILHHNAFIILSNGTDSRVGTITSPYKFFLEWKRIEEDDEGVVSLDTMLRGTCEKNRLLDLFENFLLFDGEGTETVKIMAKNHQFIGVNKVIEQTKNIKDLQGKLGVFWHTQGSGKSYSMVFICQKILRKFGKSYTFLIVLDRTELENQIYETFTGCGAVTEKDIRATSRDNLRELLSENHRYVFTLIHKFAIDKKKETEYPRITKRDNIIVISDEAHRTQGGKYAQNMRFKAIPNASFLGCTGTPLIDDEVEITKKIFGGYVSVYDFKKAIDDGATLPLRYLNRGEKLVLKNPELDQRMVDIINKENLEMDQIAKLKREFARDYPILTADDRLDKIAKDLVWHFNDRGYQGKAMFVALDKPTAVRIYDLVMAYWPEYIKELQQKVDNATDQQQELTLKKHLARVQQTEVCVVVSSEQNEVKKFKAHKLDIQPHRTKMAKRDLETEFKDEDNPFRLAIVCAMWITGFDVPCVSTIYLDKPIQGHTLMQTIARANRVHDDEKENGLIVDYGNVYKQLEKAYSVYGGNGTSGIGGGGNGPDDGETPTSPVETTAQAMVDLSAAIAAVSDFLSEVDFKLEHLVNAKSAMERLTLLSKAANAVSLNQTTRTQYEVAARDVMRKYQSLYPDDEAKSFMAQHNAIEAIYTQLNQKTKSADITDVMRKLQKEVSMSISTIDDEIREGDYVDLSNLDFDRLKLAFAKSEQKNEVVFDLAKAIDKQLKQMVAENPVRLEFYDKYKAIITEYNEGKDIAVSQKIFDDLNEFMKNQLKPEQERAMRNGLDEETLAIFDLLKKPTLTAEEEKQVKKVAKKTLEKLKEEKLKVELWRQSTQVKSQVKTMIKNNLDYLPQTAYPDDELADISLLVYQHIYSNYQGAGNSTYGLF